MTENRLQYAFSNRETDVSNSGIDSFFVLYEHMGLVRVLLYKILSVLVRILSNCNMAEHNVLFLILSRADPSGRAV